MRLIDPIELKRAISVAAMSNNHKTLEQIIDEQPTIERKTGKWIIDDDWNMCDIEGTLIGTKEYECDKCGYRELVFDGTVTHLNYCPNCGADMRGEE